MSVGAHREVNLQRFVVDHLASHGWLTSQGNEGYDKARALFVPDLDTSSWHLGRTQMQTRRDAGTRYRAPFVDRAPTGLDGAHGTP